MKKQILYFSLLLFPALHGNVLKSQDFINPNDTTVCLQLRGIATEDGKPLDDVSVALFKENEELEWGTVTSVPHHDHNFIFSLLGNSHYTVQVSREGYVSRNISISTLLPDDVRFGEDSPKAVFEIEIQMIKKKSGKEDFDVDFPFAMIKFDNKNYEFEYDLAYTNMMKEQTGAKGKKEKNKADKK